MIDWFMCACEREELRDSETQRRRGENRQEQ
jgi:hypothetical protein